MLMLWTFFLTIAVLGLVHDVYYSNKQIDILYKRTDKRLREFEAERKIRVKLQKRVSALEQSLRKRDSYLQGLRKSILDQLNLEKTDEKVL